MEANCVLREGFGIVEIRDQYGYSWVRYYAIDLLSSPFVIGKKYPL